MEGQIARRPSSAVARRPSSGQLTQERPRSSLGRRPSKLNLVAEHPLSSQGGHTSKEQSAEVSSLSLQIPSSAPARRPSTSTPARRTSTSERRGSKLFARRGSSARRDSLSSDAGSTASTRRRSLSKGQPLQRRASKTEKAPLTHAFDGLSTGSTSSRSTASTGAWSTINYKARPNELLHYVKETMADGDISVHHVEMLLSARGTNVNAKDATFGWSSLHFLANHGKHKLLKMLLNALADLHAKCNAANTALHLAARGGRVPSLQLLVARRANLNARNGNGWTAMTWSAMNGHQEVVSTLLAAAVDISLPDHMGRTASMWAACHGYVEILHELLDCAADPNEQDHYGRFLLQYADDHVQLRRAIEAQAKVNNTFLNAAMRNDPEAVRAALANGACVNTLDTDGCSALKWAVVHKSEGLMKFLVQHGANQSFKGLLSVPVEDLAPSETHADMLKELRDSFENNKRFMHAARCGDWRSAEQQVRDGAWVGARDDTSLQTALMWAARDANSDAAVLLVGASASLEPRDYAGWTAVHFAVHAGSKEVLSLLHFMGAIVAEASYEGDTLLHLAVRKNDAVILQLILAASADIETINLDGDTPLQLAAKTGALAVFRTLLAAGADARVRDHHKRPLLALAALHGHLSVTQVLLEPCAPPARILKKAELQELLKTNPGESLPGRRKGGRLKPVCDAASTASSSTSRGKAKHQTSKKKSKLSVNPGFSTPNATSGPDSVTDKQLRATVLVTPSASSTAVPETLDESSAMVMLGAPSAAEPCAPTEELPRVVDSSGTGEARTVTAWSPDTSASANRLAVTSREAKAATPQGSPRGSPRRSPPGSPHQQSASDATKPEGVEAGRKSSLEALELLEEQLTSQAADNQGSSQPLLDSSSRMEARSQPLLEQSNTSEAPGEASRPSSTGSRRSSVVRRPSKIGGLQRKTSTGGSEARQSVAVPPTKSSGTMTAVTLPTQKKSLTPSGTKAHKKPMSLSKSSLAKQALEEELLEKKYGRHSLLVNACKLREVWISDPPSTLGAPVNLLKETDEDGRTALALAAACRQPDIVCMLLKKKAPTDIRDKQGNSPLMIAAAKGDRFSLEHLMEAWAKPSFKNKDGKTAMELAATVAIKRQLERHVVRNSLGTLFSTGAEKDQPERLSGQAAVWQEESLHDAPDPKAEAKRSVTCPFRFRLEGLPTHLPADLLEGHIRALLRRLGAFDPDHVRLDVHPITQNPTGYAYVDYSSAQKAHVLTRGLGDSLCGSNVRVFRECGHSLADKSG